jgi:hypothetical protein
MLLRVRRRDKPSGFGASLLFGHPVSPFMTAQQCTSGAAANPFFLQPRGERGPEVSAAARLLHPLNGY